MTESKSIETDDQEIKDWMVNIVENEDKVLTAYFPYDKETDTYTITYLHTKLGVELVAALIHQICKDHPEVVEAYKVLAKEFGNKLNDSNIEEELYKQEAK